MKLSSDARFWIAVVVAFIALGFLLDLFLGGL
jgi:hypothetical protein